MRPLNAGELAMATPIESFTAVLLQLNMHYKTRVALKLTGISDPEPTVSPSADGAVPAPVAAGAPAPGASGPSAKAPRAKAEKPS
jgi:hypothetical protein